VPRSPAIRAAAVVAALVLVIAGWYLGSPLFIRTTTNEPAPVSTYEVFPTATAVAAPSSTGLVAVVSGPVARGDLQYVDALHNGKGAVMLIRAGDRHVVRFEDVSITNAPDVHVYLSRDTGGTWSESTSLYLGPLKATNGSFNYDVRAGADVSPYKSVVVWCRAFAVLITWADLRAV
jgi:hypothetical protein